MIKNTDQIALRTVMWVAFTVAALLGVRAFWIRLPPLASLFPTSQTEETLAPTPAPPSGTTKVEPVDREKITLRPELKQSETLEPEVRRAYPVMRELATRTPEPIAAAPSRRTVVVPAGRWSEVVSVPEGFGGSVTFTLGRIRIERNGVDLGVFYRKPSVQGRWEGPNLYVGKADPWAMLDKTPRTLGIDRGTRTLRFLGVEKKGGSVVIETQH